MTYRSVVVAMALLVQAPALLAKDPESKPIRVTKEFGPKAADPAYDTGQFLFSLEVVADTRDGAVRLAHSVLLADEMGATDYRQGEMLSDRVWAKKIFVLDSAEVTAAELFIYGSARDIRVNGSALGPKKPLVSTGWMRVAVPAALLKKGENQVVLGGSGGLLIEPAGKPGRSLKSNDGGKTWSADTLGTKNNLQGEYLVRLRLARYASRGWVRSSVFDLWAAKTGDIAVPGKLVSVQDLAALQKGQPAGTALVPWLRTGATPSPDSKTWTSWMRLDKPYTPRQAARAHRWAQLRFDLRTTRAQATPRLPSRFTFRFDFVPDPLASKDKLILELPPSGDLPRPIAIGSLPFIYQAPSPRLKLLRERYQLDKVIAAGKTEMEQLMLLRHWVRNQWHTAWGTHPASWMPPWDALVILGNKDQPDCLTMCTHYAAVYTQCCLALGWTARHCIVDHHCTAEVWVDRYQKWVMLDAGNSSERADCSLHFERNGVPLSARELLLAEKTKQTTGITVHFTPQALMAKIAPLCRPAPASKIKLPPRPDVVPIADLPKYPVCGLNNYRRYAFPARNNYLDTLVPGELYQGWSEYFFDGYCWVGDSPDSPTASPEYSRHLDPARAQDIDWSVNWVRIHLERTASSGELRVAYETHTPNLARLETTDMIGSGKPLWKPAPVTWKLKPGINVLKARSVNQFGRAGAETQVRVKWVP